MWPYAHVAFEVLASATHHSDVYFSALRHELQEALGEGVILIQRTEVTLIGSANSDRRSFDLNYENNVLFFDPTLTAEVRRRQNAYLASSHPVTAQTVAQWPMTRRLWNNTVAMLGPIL